LLPVDSLMCSLEVFAGDFLQVQHRHSTAHTRRTAQKPRLNATNKSSAL
jgi:hypothetical protein